MKYFHPRYHSINSLTAAEQKSLPKGQGLLKPTVAPLTSMDRFAEKIFRQSTKNICCPPGGFCPGCRTRWRRPTPGSRSTTSLRPPRRCTTSGCTTSATSTWSTSSRCSAGQIQGPSSLPGLYNCTHYMDILIMQKLSRKYFWKNI